MSLLFGSCNGLDALDPCAARSIVDALAFEDSNCYSGVSAMIKNRGMKGSSLLAHDDTFYDCLEYTEAEASDSVQYDIGTSPLMLRGGHSWNGKPLAFMSAKSVNESELDDRVRQRQQQPPPPPTTTTTTNDAATAVRESFDPPPPPTELPDRFLRAGKMDPVEGLRRYQATLEWRREQRMDHILKEPFPLFDLVRANYPLYCHLKGLNGESVYYEKPPQTNLKLLKANGAGLDLMLRYYAMVTEFGWQWLDRSDSAKSIYIIDLNGIRLTDFAGDVIDFVRKASAFTGANYPERSGCIFIINVPSWFKMIWSVVKPMVDVDTLKKIYILRGKKEICNAMLERIPIENIPPEYGGTSMPLGQSPQDQTLSRLMHHNNALARGEKVCPGPQGGCQFCRFQIARSY